MNEYQFKNYLSAYLMLTLLFLIMSGCLGKDNIIPTPEKKEVRLDFYPIDTKISEAKIQATSDLFKAANIYNEAANLGKKELNDKPHAVGVKDMVRRIDQAIMGKISCLLTIAEENKDIDQKKRTVESVTQFISSIDDKNNSQYKDLENRLDKLRHQIEETEKITAAPSPPITPKPSDLSSTKTAEIKKNTDQAGESVKTREEPKDVAKDPSKIKKEPTKNDRTDTKQINVDGAKQASKDVREPVKEEKPSKAAENNPHQKQDAKTIQLAHSELATRQGSLGVGQTIIYQVITSGETKYSVGDLEILVPEGYLVDGDKLKPTGVKPVPERGNAFFVRFIREKIDPGSKINITVTRNEKGAENYECFFYLYPR